MKKILLLCGLVVIISLLFNGCTNNNKGEKLCRIEISGAAKQNNIAVLEQLKQSDISEFFDENNWTEAVKISSELIPQYTISLYQEKTKAVIKSKNDEQYEKIMEYITYENSDIVKVTIGGDVINSSVSNKYLSEYYIASEEFFSALDNALKN